MKIWIQDLVFGSRGANFRAIAFGARSAGVLLLDWVSVAENTQLALFRA